MAQNVIQIITVRIICIKALIAQIIRRSSVIFRINMADTKDKVGWGWAGFRMRSRFVYMNGQSIYCPTKRDHRAIIMTVLVWATFFTVIYAGSDRGGIYVIKPHTLAWNQHDYMNGWTYGEALDACVGMGNRLATVAEVRVAYERGFDYCLWIWAADPTAGPPMFKAAVAMLATRDTSDGCGRGGVHEGSRMHMRQYYPVCYGTCPSDSPCTLI
jgi:hypothetical protein